MVILLSGAYTIKNAIIHITIIFVDKKINNKVNGPVLIEERHSKTIWNATPTKKIQIPFILELKDIEVLKWNKELWM